MEKIAWDDKFNIGVDEVDKAHAKLFRIIRKMYDMSQNAEINQHTYKEGIKYLESYSMKHFMEEEAYMRSIRYDGFSRHKRIHDNFRDKTLVSLKKNLEQSSYSPLAVQHFLGVMSNWLVEHIMREDQAIVGRTPIRQSPDFSSQVSIISKSLNQAMLDVFQVGAKLVSADYKGENIGRGVYCRQWYDIKGGIRLQLLLGVEESLLSRGVRPGQDGKVTKESILQVFDKLFQDVGKSFHIEMKYKLGKKNLMTQDEFRKDFMKGYPCRLLFNTKQGYSIFCYRGWRIKKENTETGEKMKETSG